MKSAARLMLVALLATLLAFPAAAHVTPEPGDQTELSAEEIAEAIANGEVDTSEPEEWSEGDAGISTYSRSAPKALTTVGGATRYDTSAAQALHSFSYADVVIVVGGETYADSIAGSSLAGALDAPISFS